MDYIAIYTDGGCPGNPGPGAWALIIDGGPDTVKKCGYEEWTTNNKMELRAVIEALKYVKNLKIPIQIFTDSQYVKNGITDWIVRWQKNGWKTSQKKPVKNQVLWQELHRLTNQFKIQWFWIKGHSGTVLNEECDIMVQNALKK